VQIPPVKNQEWQKSLVTAAGVVAKNYQPDFIGLQEVDYLQPRSGGINQTKVIAEKLGLKHWAYLPSLIGTPGERWHKVEDLEEALITEKSKQVSKEMSYGIGIATNVAIKKLYLKSLGRSWVGMPLLIPREGAKGVKFIYVKDEPRIALIAELENGVTIANTHLSFVPGVNVFQLNRLSSFMKDLPGDELLIGDLNLPGNLPTKVSGFKSLISHSTYPSWKPSIQFDYIMVRKSAQVKVEPLPTLNTSISDHVPIGVQLKFQSGL
jgi:endonuclease/exonuclease/phosphatase family metal-dependent hydrolase